MRIGTDTRAGIGGFFACLGYGEQIARDCALRQAEMAPRSYRRFFERQARQEYNHARIFESVVLGVSPRQKRTIPDPMVCYRRRLQTALRCRDLVATIVGQQIVLEALGELVLSRLDERFERRRLGFKRLRRILLAQERGHLAFGARIMQDSLSRGEADPGRVRELVLDYLRLSDSILDDMAFVFDIVGADPELYKHSLRQRMEIWTAG